MRRRGSGNQRHRFSYPGHVRSVHELRCLGQDKPVLVAGPEQTWIEGVADDAPSANFERASQRLRDLSGVVHCVVKGDDELWRYCHIDVMRDWLEQDGRNLVSDDVPVTCLRCISQDYEG